MDAILPFAALSWNVQWYLCDSHTDKVVQSMMLAVMVWKCNGSDRVVRGFADLKLVWLNEKMCIYDRVWAGKKFRARQNKAKIQNLPIINAGDSGVGVDCSKSFGEHPARAVRDTSTHENVQFLPAKLFNYRLGITCNIDCNDRPVSWQKLHSLINISIGWNRFSFFSAPWHWKNSDTVRVPVLRTRRSPLSPLRMWTPTYCPGRRLSSSMRQNPVGTEWIVTQTLLQSYRATTESKIKQTSPKRLLVRSPTSPTFMLQPQPRPPQVLHDATMQKLFCGPWSVRKRCLIRRVVLHQQFWSAICKFKSTIF